MVFQSLDFLAFLAVVLGLYWLLPRAAQNVLLLVGSAFFYGYVHPWFLLPLGFSLLVDYTCALRIEARPSQKRAWLALSVVSNLSLLATFKYLGFGLENLNAIRGLAGLEPVRLALSIALPAGISFYVFHTLSYVIDVYRGLVPARRRFVDLAVFVTFFPQLVAGPIARAQQLLPQFERDRRFDPAVARDGVLLIVWGFFKKLVIADSVATTVEKVFSLDSPGFPLLWAGVLAFCIQIYADFSAYTDIARGTARLFGVELAENFRHPYLARSPEDFWARWHISLSSWMRDYLYIPLGGSRCSAWRSAGNVMVVFAVSGLWHGASWNFVLWGVYWGALLVLYRVGKAKAPAVGRVLPGWLKVLVMFVLINVGWLFFRETDSAHLWRALTLSPSAAGPFEWAAAGWLTVHTALCALPLALHAAGEAWLERARLRDSTPRDRLALAGPLLALLLMLGLMTLRSDRTLDFIYFQF